MEDLCTLNENIKTYLYICKHVFFCACVKSLQSCSTLCVPMECSLPGSPSMGSSRKEYSSGWPCPPPRDLPNLGIEPESLTSLALAGWSFTTSATWEAPWFPFSQFSSVQSLSRVGLCDPMNRSRAGLPVYHQLPEFTQTHVHQVSDAIQPSYPLLSPSPPAPNPSQHQSLFQRVNSSYEVAKVLEFQL